MHARLSALILVALFALIAGMSFFLGQRTVDEGSISRTSVSGKAFIVTQNQTVVPLASMAIYFVTEEELLNYLSQQFETAEIRQIREKASEAQRKLRWMIQSQLALAGNGRNQREVRSLEAEIRDIEKMVTYSILYGLQDSGYRTILTDSLGEYFHDLEGDEQRLLIATSQRRLLANVEHYVWILELSGEGKLSMDLTNRNMFDSNCGECVQFRFDSIELVRKE